MSKAGESRVYSLGNWRRMAYAGYTYVCVACTVSSRFVAIGSPSTRRATHTAGVYSNLRRYYLRQGLALLSILFYIARVLVHTISSVHGQHTFSMFMATELPATANLHHYCLGQISHRAMKKSDNLSYSTGIFICHRIVLNAIEFASVPNTALTIA